MRYKKSWVEMVSLHGNCSQDSVLGNRYLLVTCNSLTKKSAGITLIALHRQGGFVNRLSFVLLFCFAGSLAATGEGVGGTTITISDENQDFEADLILRMKILVMFNAYQGVYP